MSRNTRRSRRRTASILRSNRKSWFRRYLRALSTGVTAASIGTVSLLGQQAHAANDIWVGNTSALFSVPANWSTAPTGPVSGDTLEFGVAGTSGTTLTDDLTTPAAFNVARITYDVGAPAYTINPGVAATNGFTLTGNIINNSTSLQTINDNIVTTANRTITLTPGGGNMTLGGAISGAAGGLILTSSAPTVGGGTLNIAGANTYTNQTLIQIGTANLTGSIIPTASITNPSTQVGGTAGQQGALNVAAGATLTGIGQETWLATADGGYGVLNNNGGTVNVGSWFALARGGGQGVYNQSGGSLTVTGNPFTIGSFGGSTTDLHGVVNISGGTVTTVSQPIYVGEQTNSVLTISGTAQVTAGAGVSFSQNAANTGILNLNGGTLFTTRVNQNITTTGTTANGTINFNGGILKATASSGTFMPAAGAAQGLLGGAFINAGGATIDDSGFNITINQALQAPTGNGVSATGLTFSGGGLIGTPVVEVLGDGVGATAVANVDASGNLSGITITNPGRNYQTPPTFVLLGGGVGNTAAVGGTATLVPTTSGPLTKVGTGTLTLGGTSTYTGATNVTAGTLLISSTGSINGSSSITVGSAGSPANLITNSTTAISPAVALSNGTVNGTGTINSLTVANSASNVLGNGSNGAISLAQPLTIGNLTFSGAAKFAPVTSLAQAAVPAVGVTNLTASGSAGSVSVVPTNTSGGWSNGTYHLVSYTGSIGGTGFPAFTLNISGVGARQTSALQNNAGFIDLVIGGNSAVWTGAANGNWTTTAIASPKNWALSSNQAPTDYVAGDSVFFDDTATGATSVNVTDTNVAPALVTFNNSAKNYTVSGNPIAGAGGIIMNGTGSVTLNNANTFSGGILANSGTLLLGLPNASNTATASAIGTGRLTLGGGTTIDNTSGAAATLLTNNLETWNGDITFTGSNDLNLGTGAVTINPNATQAHANQLTVVTAAHTLSVGGITGAGVGLYKDGPGTLVINGSGSISGTATVPNGTLQFAGGTTALGGTIRIGPNTTTGGVVKVTGGTLAISGTGPSIGVGFVQGSNSTFIVTGGTVTIPGETWLAPDLNTYGAFTVQGGTVTENGIFAMSRQTGANGGQCGISILNVSGGTLNVANNVAGGSFGSGGAASGALALMNVSAGAFNTTGNNGIYVGGGAYPGYLNVWGNGSTQGQVTVGATTTDGLIVGLAAPAAGSTLNLGAIGGGITNNGRITTARAVGGTAANTLFNWHGGTLRGSANDAAIGGTVFMTGFTNAYVYSEGAVVDTQTFNDTISQNLQAPTGQGVAATAAGLVNGLTVSGTGFIDTPYVQVTGGDGTGASAVAVIDYTTGNLTGIRLTNPGTGYTIAPTFTLVGGGLGATGTITGAATLAANSSGALTKLGTGRLALSGNNSYTGGTFVNAGLLAINSPTALGTGALTIGAAGAGIDNTTAATMTNGNAEFWNFDLVYGGTRNLILNGAISLGTSANASRQITTNAATAGTSLTISSSITNGTNATTPTTGLSKAGTGTLILAGNNAFTGTLGVSAGTLQITGTNALTGATSVTGGTLNISGTGSINTSSGITVNGAAAKLLQTGTVAISTPVTLTLGTIDGTTTINNVTVANAAGAILNHGNGTGSALTIGSLTFSGAATVNVTTSPAVANSPKYIIVTTLATNAAANATIAPVNTLGYWDPGTYQAISYTGTIGGAGFAGLQLPTTALAGYGARQTSALSNTVAGQVNVVIGGNRALWTGAGDGNWDTATHTPQNWKLSVAGTPTDFVAADSTQFDDTATGSTTINIAANVTPTNAIFNNSTKNYTIQSSGAFGITGASALVAKNGSGSLTISSANTYGGGTVLNAGTLNINNASAIGTGRLTINGGTIDNKTGSALTLTTNNLGSWGGSFTFADSSDLNLGTGTITLGADSSATIAAGDLTVGPMTSTTAGLTKAGPGTLTINSSTTASTIGGPLNVTGGLFQIGLPGSGTASNFTTGGLSGTGTIENGSTGATTAASTLVTNNVADSTFSGILQDGSGGARLGLSKGGAGTLTLSGNSTLSNGIAVTAGQLVLTGSINPTQIGAIGQNTISGTAAPTAIMTLATGSTLTSPKTTAPSVQVGGGAGSAGVLRVNAGSTLNAASELWLATADGGYGAMDMAGGTVNVGSWLALGRGGGQGILNQSGGSITVQTNNLTVGSFGGATGNGVVHGQVNLTGGTLSTVNNAYAGEQTNGVINVSGTGHLIVDTSGAAGTALIAAVTNAGTLGIVNLLPGGLITTPQVHQGAGQGVINFQGGVLQANTDSSAFMTPTGFTGTLKAYAYPGNAVIDSNGHTLFMDEPISPPTGNGVSAAGLTVSGGGYASTPVVQITGGGGVGATANATIDSNGNLTGVTITNPGVNYTSAPTFALLGGGIGTTGKINGTPTLAPNVSGGLTKVGSGSLTLIGLSTYTGPTTIKQGVLTPGIANAIPTASTIVMAGGNLATGGLAAQFGPLQVTDNSGIDLGFGSGVVDFASSTAIPWTPNKAVSILNWTGAPNTAGGTDQLTFDSAGLTAAQIAAVHFQGYNGAKFIGNELVPISTTTRKLGDINVDGHVNAADVTAMLGMLTDLNAYKTSKSLSTDDILNIGDIDSSGSVTNADLQALITYIQSGNGSLAPVPEPGTLVLLVCGAIPGAAWLVRSRRKNKGDVA